MNTVRNFECPNELEIENLFPTHWFNNRPEICISLPCCQIIEKQSHKFLRSLQLLTEGQCKLKIKNSMENKENQVPV